MDLLIFACVVAIVVMIGCAIVYYTPVPQPLKWILPLLLGLIGIVLILSRLVRFT
jgi:uncharacterized membrane protein YfcA